MTAGVTDARRIGTELGDRTLRPLSTVAGRRRLLIASKAAGTKVVATAKPTTTTVTIGGPSMRNRDRAKNAISRTTKTSVARTEAIRAIRPHLAGRTRSVKASARTKRAIAGR